MILVATRSTSLRDGLLMLLAAIAPERSSEHVEETQIMLDRLVETPVELIMLDAELLAVSAEKVLGRIKATSPATRCLILAKTVGQQEELKRLDGEEVLLQGTPAAEIATAIERLLNAAATSTN